MGLPWSMHITSSTNNFKALKNALRQEWNAIPQNAIRRLIGLTRTARDAAHGGQTR